MNTKHTKGPYRLSAAALDGFMPIMAPGGVIVALISTLGANAQADGQLLAAAPELLDALKRCLPENVCLTNRNIHDHVTVSVDVTMGELRQIAAVIAKATGAS
jgi:hypothetical protein